MTFPACGTPRRKSTKLEATYTRILDTREELLEDPRDWVATTPK
jgi:hypothetical protein